MPEGRMLSKSIATSEQVASVSLLADYLFTRMIPHLDCDGRMSGSPRTVRGIVCPLREDVTAAQVGAALLELHAVGLLVLYVVDGQQYVEFPKFRHHQRGARFDRESASRIPPSSEGTLANSGPTPADSGSAPVVLPLSEVKGSEGKGSEDLSPPAAPAILIAKAPRAKRPSLPWMGAMRAAWTFGDLLPGDATLLANVVGAVGEEEAVRRLGAYCATVNPTYGTVRDFVSKHALYADVGPKLAVDPRTGILNAVGVAVMREGRR